MRTLKYLTLMLAIGTSLFVAIRGLKAGPFDPAPPPIEYQISGTLSSAQILALNGTPVVVIVAPGAGKIISIDEFTAELVFNTIAYTGGGTVGVTYLGGFQTGLSCGVNLIIATQTEICQSSASTFVPAVATAIVNQSVALAVTGPPFAAGNSPLSYWIKYHVLTGF